MHDNSPWGPGARAVNSKSLGANWLVFLPIAGYFGMLWVNCESLQYLLHVVSVLWIGAFRAEMPHTYGVKPISTALIELGPFRL